MAEHFSRLFTVREANALIPKLKELLKDVSTHRDAMREKAPHMEPILVSAATNGGGKIGSEYGVEAYSLYQAIERIRDTGVLLRDLDTGLLDFPHERDNRIIFLCWMPPEERIEYWHGIQDGFDGRQPL